MSDIRKFYVLVLTALLLLLSGCATKQDSPGCTAWGEARQKVNLPDGGPRKDAFTFWEQPCIRWSNPVQDEQDRREILRRHAYESKFPLHSAVRYRDSKSVESLLAAGATVKQKDDAGKFPIHWLGQSNDYRPEPQILGIVKVLKAHGQDISTAYELLHSSVHNHHLELIKFLNANGADVNKVFDGKTSLDRAMSNYACDELSLDTRYASAKVKRLREAQRESCNNVLNVLNAHGAKRASELR